jgi:hypothetical protein
MSWDFQEWDFSQMTQEEYDAFWSGVRKGGDEYKSNEELAAYNKAVQLNVPDADVGYGKAGFGQDVKDFQRQAYMYSSYDENEQRELWARRTLGNGGLTDENGTWVQGEWEDGLFYPADGQSPCLGASPGMVDSQGTAVPPS